MELENYALVRDVTEETKPVRSNTGRDIEFTARIQVPAKVNTKQVLIDTTIGLQDKNTMFVCKDLQCSRTKKKLMVPFTYIALGLTYTQNPLKTTLEKVWSDHVDALGTTAARKTIAEVTKHKILVTLNYPYHDTFTK